MNIRQRKSERHKDMLRKLSQNGGNRSCFDCGMRGPLYVVSDFGILVCSGCSAVHRSFQHKVKGITMSEFTDEEIARFSVSGNDRGRKVWLSTFHDQLPSSGDVMALKSHVRVVFEERRYWDAQEFSALRKSWEHPSEQPLQGLPTKTETNPAASALPPAPEARTAMSGSASAAATPAPPSWAATPPPPISPAPPARPPQDDVFDSLFAAPVQSPQMPQSAAHSAPAEASLMAASRAAAPPAPQQPSTVASIVGDLFAGVPPPAVQPAGVQGVFHPQQQQPMGYHTGGITYNFTQGLPSSMMAPHQLQFSHLTYQQQQPMPYTASGPTAHAPFAGDQASKFDLAAPSAPAANAPQNQQQQQPFTWGQPAPAQLQQPQQGIMGIFGTSGPAAPYSAPTQPQGYNFNSAASSANPYPSASGTAPQAHQPPPFASNPPQQKEGWCAPSVPNASPTPNHNHIAVLSVTKQQDAEAKNAHSPWP
ncbi:hypothetical protein LSCM1_00336 [Leishmania martiniquensis]|uniref:Arf-GAP domain-containing protein n=1 Tax=Leishmania martiniquensis TaxID=1580590 RepID=A0A836GSG5_9TRYP|nr:hypothetical protein LSCM1_00336 [Leishmania martiniquensis]